MDCGRCPKCLLGGQCINSPKSTLYDGQNATTEKCKISEIPDTDITSKLPSSKDRTTVPVPSDPSIYSCGYCCAYLRHEELGNHEKKHVNRGDFSKEEIYFIWYHHVDLQENWNTCLKAVREFLPHLQRTKTGIRSAFYKRVKTHMKRERQYPSVSTVCTVEYPWMAQPPKKEYSKKCSHCDKAFRDCDEGDKHEVSRICVEQYDKEKLWFIWYHLVDLNMTWDQCLEALQEKFKEKRKKRQIQKVFYRFAHSKVDRHCTLKALPSVFTFYEIPDSWMAMDKNAQGLHRIK